MTVWVWFIIQIQCKYFFCFWIWNHVVLYSLVVLVCLLMSCLGFNLHLRSKCPRVLHIWHLFHVFLTLHSQIIYNLLRCICYIRCEFYRQTYPAVDIILLQWSFTCVWSRALLTYALSVWSRVVNCLVSLWMVSPEVDFCFMDWAILTSSPRARSTLIRSLS